MYAQLGNIIFEGLKGFRSYEETRASSYAEHQLIGGKPRLQRTGSQLMELNFGMKLHSMFCNPEAEIRALEVARENGDVLPLVTGAGFFVGQFVILSFRVSQTRTNSRGEIIVAEVTVELKETAEPSATGIADGFASILSAPLLVEPIVARSGAASAMSAELMQTTAQAAQIDANMAAADGNPTARPVKNRDTLRRLQDMKEGLDRLQAGINDAGNLVNQLLDFRQNILATKRAVENLESFTKINDFESAMQANRDLQGATRQMSSSGSVLTKFTASRRAA